MFFRAPVTLLVTAAAVVLVASPAAAAAAPPTVATTTMTSAEAAGIAVDQPVGGVAGDVLYLVSTPDSPPQVVMAPSAGTVIPFGTGWQRPLSITVDPSGTVWVLDSDGTQQRIVRPDATGANQETFVEGLTGATSIASDSAGNLYVGSAQMGGVIGFPAGSTERFVLPAWEFLQSGGPVGPLAVSPTGTLAVISAGTVFLAPEGNVLPLTSGSTLSFDGGGNLYLGVDDTVVVRGGDGLGPAQSVIPDWPSAAMAFTAASVGYIASGQQNSFVLRYSGGQFTSYLPNQPGVGWAAVAVSPPAAAAVTPGPQLPGPEVPGVAQPAEGSATAPVSPRELAASGADPLPRAVAGIALLLLGATALVRVSRRRARC